MTYFVGYAKPASEMLKVVIDEAGKNFDNANDQKLIADLYINHRFGIQLDFYNKIFQSMHMTLDPPLSHCDPNEDIILKENSAISNKIGNPSKTYYNKLTNSYPGVFHFNGGGKRFHLEMESQQWYKKNYLSQSNPESKIRVENLEKTLLKISKASVLSELTYNEMCETYIKSEYFDER